MKKFSFIIILLIIISMTVSCGTSDLVKKDLDEDRNIVEKAKEEVNEELKEEAKEELGQEVSQEAEEQEEQEEIELEQEKNQVDKDNIKDKETYTQKEDKPQNPIYKETIKDSQPRSNLKKIEKKAYATVNNLNIRSLGSMKGKIITSINRGVEVYVFGERDGWYYVEYAKNKKGWVYSRYMQFSPIKVETPVPKEPPKTPDLKKIEEKGYATVNSLNVRSLGSMKGKIITAINRGVEVHVFGEKDGWYYVEYAKNQRGWVYSKYIQFTPIKTRPSDTSALSNKSYSWYFIRNNKHQQPGFDNSYKALLDKYDGIAIGDKNKKDIFLTFDNGYENGYTSKILDVLKKQNVNVAFFVQGSYIDANPEIVKRMVREGHIVLNHTNNHPKMPTLSREKLQNEINITAEKYKKLTGKNMLKFLRPPSGEFSERTLAETKQLGYRTVFWSMAYRDWVVDDQPGKTAAYKHVTDNIHNGAVILLHSVSKSNTQALEDIIKELKSQGYKFKLLTEYP